MINMINNYKDLTLEKYIELYELDICGMEEIDIQSYIISILTNMTVDEILDLPIPQYKKLAQQTAFMTVPPQVKGRKISKVNINGKEYEVLDKIDKMTTGQYIDYQTYLKKNDVKMLPYILSTLIIPKGEKYGDSDTVEDLKQMTVEEALTISNFFMNKSLTLIKGTLRYLEYMMKKKMKKVKEETMKQQMTEAIQKLHSLQSSLKNGVGCHL
jgi:hypothetical protein